jgi:hypothetical protein
MHSWTEKSIAAVAPLIRDARIATRRGAAAPSKDIVRGVLTLASEPDPALLQLPMARRAEFRLSIISTKYVLTFSQRG